MSQALYRKYRSKNLDEVVGQGHITAILKRAVENDKIAHAYLLTGPKGVGKTSIARILAHTINKLPYSDETQHLDIIEIDAASNNSVEDVRDLRDKVQIMPVSAAYKVYIIDEVHMLSKAAFNALLKTLEEPPSHIVFILATTDADKLPATIISRVQRFNFRAITEADSVEHLKAIAKMENIDIEDAAVKLIAAHGNGSFRDSISLLDQMQSLADGAITHTAVAQVLGQASDSLVAQLIAAYTAGDLSSIITLLNDADSRGTPPAVLTEQLVRAIRANITNTPQLLPLLDDLLEVNKSAWPEVKLMTALAKNANITPPQPIAASQPAPAAALPAPSDEPTAPEPKAEPATPSEPPKPKKTAPRPEVADISEPNIPKIQNPKSKIPSEPNSSIQNPKSKISPSPSPSTQNPEPNSSPFNWVNFTEALKPISSGAYAILTNCSYDFDGTNLTIYAGKKFNKARLDKAMPQLLTAMGETEVEATITIVDTLKPPADATTAAILDMMGGGEEISA